MKGASGQTINPYVLYPHLPKTSLPLRLLSKQCRGPCVVIGGGESARKCLKAHGLPGCFTIACNHAIEQYNADMVLVQDYGIFQYPRFRAAVEGRRTFLITSLSRPSNRLSTSKTSGFYYWRTRAESTSEWEGQDPTHVLKTPSVLSGSQAVVIAHGLGFYPIICLGLDANYEKDSYRYGFDHPKWGRQYAQTNTRQMMIDAQTEFLSDNASKMVLFNCSYGNWSRQIDYKEVLSLVTQNSQDSRELVEAVWKANMMRQHPQAVAIYERKRRYKHHG